VKGRHWTAEEWARFQRAWNDAEDFEGVCARFGMTPNQASHAATRGRDRGLQLKTFNGRGRGASRAA
jgi:hypothetical protein